MSETAPLYEVSMVRETLANWPAFPLPADFSGKRVRP
jgi:hypothetical protein